jgi:putative DNA primase/helicase
MTKEEKTLTLAKKLCAENQFISVQELGRIYIYRHGVYSCIAYGKCNHELHQMIIDDEVGKTLSPSKRQDVILNISALVAVPESQINPEGIFNFQDGLYDIRSDTFANHSPDYKITIQIPYKYKECIFSPLWDKFLNDVTGCDQNKKDLLQEFAGYCLTRSCKHEKALFLIGSGSNGKSVFSETIASVFGTQNISSVSLEHLANPVLRCNILNKFINIDSDLPRNAEKFEETFRKITSGEPILFNEKFISAYTTSPFCKLIYCLNEFPAIDDASNAFYRRMILIPFEVEFSNGSQDTELKNKLKVELAGIFRWAVLGYRRLIKQGFSDNKDMLNNISEVRIDNNPIMAFVSTNINLKSPTTAITKSGLYSSFKEWAKNHGHHSPAFRRFNRRFFNTYKKYTKFDYQMTTGDREAAWPNISYLSQNTYDNGLRQMGFEGNEHETNVSFDE